uniref:C2H2-type domain-containing protein n=1 Tax=Parastrongyloides trichosuri TaxID=131310 RepID=A0A0N4ZMS9_PARTI
MVHIILPTKSGCLFCGKFVPTKLLTVHIESHIIYSKYCCSECNFECYDDMAFLDHASETFHLPKHTENLYIPYLINVLSNIIEYAYTKDINFINPSFKVSRKQRDDIKGTSIHLQSHISCLLCKSKVQCIDISNHIKSHLNFLNLLNIHDGENKFNVINGQIHNDGLIKCTLKTIEDDFMFAARFGISSLLESDYEIKYF